MEDLARPGSVGLIIRKVEGLDFGFDYNEREHFKVGCRIISADDHVDLLFEASRVVVAPKVALFPAECFLPFPKKQNKIISIYLLSSKIRETGEPAGVCSVDCEALLKTGDRVFGGPLPVVVKRKSKNAAPGCAHVTINFFDMALEGPVIDHAGKNLASGFASLFAGLRSPQLHEVGENDAAAISTWRALRDAPKRTPATPDPLTSNHVCKLDKSSRKLLTSRLGLPEETPVSAECSSRWSGCAEFDDQLPTPTHVAVLIEDVDGAVFKEYRDKQKINFHLATAVDECLLPLGTPKILEVTPTGGTLTVELLTEKHHPHAAGAVIISNELPPPHLIASQEETQRIRIKLAACSGKPVGEVSLRVSFLCLESDTPRAHILENGPLSSRPLYFGKQTDDSVEATTVNFTASPLGENSAQSRAGVFSPASTPQSGAGAALGATIWGNLAEDKPTTRTTRSPKAAKNSPPIVIPTRKPRPGVDIPAPVQVTSRSINVSDDEDSADTPTQRPLGKRNEQVQRKRGGAGAQQASPKDTPVTSTSASSSTVDLLGTGGAGFTDTFSPLGGSGVASGPESSTPDGSSSPGARRVKGRAGDKKLFAALFQAGKTARPFGDCLAAQQLDDDDDAEFSTAISPSALQAEAQEGLSRLLAHHPPSLIATEAALNQAKEAGLLASNRPDLEISMMSAGSGATAAEFQKAMAQGLLCSGIGPVEGREPPAEADSAAARSNRGLLSPPSTKARKA